MAETAKILAPDKTVLIPDARAGCSLADTITADQLRAWKAEHPGAVVVSYVNTTAEVKAETDICCTSSNAVEVVESIPADREVLFCPDQFLGAHVQRVTGRAEHAHLDGRVPRARRHHRPPTCGASVEDAPGRRAVRPPRVRLRDQRAVPGRPTAQLPDRARPRSCPPAGWSTQARRTTAKQVLVATEIGMLHQLRKANPVTDFQPVNPRAACQYMKMITPEKLLRVAARGPRRGHRRPRRSPPAPAPPSSG